ncbi:unnamed protein product [Protopolystoma xenopodis]|uniref:Uncharacterized protein n=1 Tax=Protopolystoma xenopodis TaxID=117903 RepID=A0A3S5AIQ0_9PLAT|nr:unnamed protein product [Protopolystoma xenopodis]
MPSSILSTPSTPQIPETGYSPITQIHSPASICRSQNSTASSFFSVTETDEALQLDDKRIDTNEVGGERDKISSVSILPEVDIPHQNNTPSKAQDFDSLADLFSFIALQTTKKKAVSGLLFPF